MAKAKPAGPPPQAYVPQVPADDKARAVAATKAVEDARGGTRAIVYWLTDSARISEAAVVPLYDQLSAMGKQPAIDLVLFTRGGSTEVPWRMVSLIREYCDRFAVLIPHRAQSAQGPRAEGEGHVQGGHSEALPGVRREMDRRPAPAVQGARRFR